MIKLLAVLLMIPSLVLPVSALQLEAPTVPSEADARMPSTTDSFSDGLTELLRNALASLRPDVLEAIQVSTGLIASALIVSVLDCYSNTVRKTANLTGTAVVAGTLLLSTRSMIRLSVHTIQELSSYGKLLFPVMTTAMAAQGGLTSSAALCVGTTVFDTILTECIIRLLIPMVYLFTVLAIANSAVGEDLLRRLRDLLKNAVSWCLKTILTVFTTYMSITGVVSGTTDAAALKATKVTISSVVPVVGSILSDASEAVLVSAGLAKNAAGIYGILALLAIGLQPFLKIGLHYLLLKATGAVCSIWGEKGITALIEDFSTAMGLLLGMTGGTCLLTLISTVCFLKGVG